MKPTNHPQSSAHYVPKGAEVGRTIDYILRSNQEPIRVLRALVQSQLENILDLIVEDDEMKGVVFAYTIHEKLTRTQSDRMRRFLWGKFASGLDASGEEEQDEDAGEFGNQKLKILGEKIRQTYADNWWTGDMNDTAEVITSLIQEIFSYYGGEQREDIDVSSQKKNTVVKTKKQDKHPFEKIPYGGDASLAIEREDAMSIDLAISMMESYFDTMDMKISGKLTTQKPLTHEKELGRWASIVKILQEMKKLSSHIPILDALEEHFNDSPEGLKSVIRRFDSYSILHEEEEL